MTFTQSQRNHRSPKPAVNWRPFMWALIPLCIWGCETRGSDTPNPYEPPTPGATATPVEFEAQGRFATLRVVAMWVKNLDSAHIFTDPEDDWFIQQTYIYLVSDMQPNEAGGLKVSEETCHMDLSVIGGLDTLPGPGLIDHLLPVQLEGELIAAEPWPQFTTTQYADLWGAKLNAPLTDPLPTDEEHSTVWDQEQDGNPGVTIELVVDESGQQFGLAYITQRVLFRLDGHAVDGERLEGNIHVDGAEQIVLDSPQAYIRLSDPEVKPVDDISLSFFQMIRVADDFDCAQMQSYTQREGLFPGYGMAGTVE